jgi:hypothetical protein
MIDTASLKIFISKDNQRWKELDSRTSIVDLRIEGRQLLYVSQPEQDARYWKVHFGRTDNPRSFFNSLDDIIRVFG